MSIHPVFMEKKEKKKFLDTPRIMLQNLLLKSADFYSALDKVLSNWVF